MRHINDGLSERARRALSNYGISTDEEVRAKTDEELLKLPGLGRETLIEIRRWAGGEENYAAERPDLDRLLVEAWIEELKAEQDRCQPTPNGYRRAAQIAWKLGTLRSLLP
jgi:DNA-directed RNA polymerase alpha subunit